MRELGREQTSNVEKMASKEQVTQDGRGDRIPGMTVKERPRTTAEQKEVSRASSADGSKKGTAPGAPPPGNPTATRRADVSGVTDRRASFFHLTEAFAE